LEGMGGLGVVLDHIFLIVRCKTYQGAFEFKVSCLEEGKIVLEKK